jgi:hypothetical protein
MTEILSEIQIITTFICHANDCPNKDIEYRMVDAKETAMCGGCKATLTGTKEN